MKLSLVPDRTSPGASVAELSDAAITRAFVPVVGPKDGPALLACALRVGEDGRAYRKASNAESMGALVADLDGLPDAVYRSARAALLASPYEHWFHETFSSRVGHRCARVWFPFTCALRLEGLDWGSSWASLLEHVGFPVGVADAACSDPARLYYLPRHPAGEVREHYHASGERLDPDAYVYTAGEVAGKPPAAPPAEDPARPVDLADVRERLARVARGDKPAAPHVRSLLNGAPLAPAGGRYVAWRGALGVLGAVAEPWESSEALLSLCSASRAAEMSADPDMPHEWSTLEGLLDSAREHAATQRALYAHALEGLVVAAPAAPAAACVEAPPTTPPRARLINLPHHFPDPAACVAAISAAAEQPVVIHTGGHLTVGTMLPGDLGARFAPMGIQGFREVLVGRECAFPGSRRGRPAADVWLEYAQPRYTSLTTQADSTKAPAGCYNLWQGLGVVPRAGDVAPMLALMDVLTAGHAPDRDYLERWCAWGVQHPTERAEVAVIIRGAEGIGKSRFAETLLRIYGAHGRTVSSAKALVGDFNSQLAGACLILAEEVFLLGRDASERIKALVTGPTLDIEGKGVDRFETRNCSKIIVLTNSARALRVEGLGRRWFPLSAGTGPYAHGTPEYTAHWRAWNQWLESGGVEAWAHHLLAIDLGSWHPRQRPVTEALRDEQIATQSDGHPLGWLREVAELGAYGPYPLPTELEKWVSTADLWAAYQDWCRNGRREAVHSLTPFGRALAAVLVAARGPRPVQARGWSVPCADDLQQRLSVAANPV